MKLNLAKREEELLKSYEKLINWGVKKFKNYVEGYMDADDIRQEGRIVILKLIRKYNNDIGTLDGYIKSLFYKSLRNALKIDKKRINLVYAESNSKNIDGFHTNSNIDEITIERVQIIKNVSTNYEFKKLLDYSNGISSYKDCKIYIQRIKRRVREKVKV